MAAEIPHAGSSGIRTRAIRIEGIGHAPGYGVVKRCPLLRQEGLKNGIVYYDAQMDDSRFVIRVIREAVMAGGTALNYAKVSELLRDENGKVDGVMVEDQTLSAPVKTALHAKVVINAAGPWSD